jgi:hypothetical protein
MSAECLRTGRSVAGILVFGFVYVCMRMCVCVYVYVYVCTCVYVGSTRFRGQKNIGQIVWVCVSARAPNPLTKPIKRVQQGSEVKKYRSTRMCMCIRARS